MGSGFWNTGLNYRKPRLKMAKNFYLYFYMELNYFSKMRLFMTRNHHAR